MWSGNPFAASTEKVGFDVAAHAFGIARALEIGPKAAAFATLGMGLMGCAIAFLVPLAFVAFG